MISQIKGKWAQKGVQGTGAPSHSSPSPFSPCLSFPRLQRAHPLFATSTQSWQGEGPEPSPAGLGVRPAPLRALLGSDPPFTNEGKSERPVDGVGGNSHKRKIPALPAPSQHQLQAEQCFYHRRLPPAAELLAEGTVWPLPGSHLRCGAHPGSRRGHFSLRLAAPSRRLSPLCPQPVCGQPRGGGAGAARSQRPTLVGPGRCCPLCP